MLRFIFDHVIARTFLRSGAIAALTPLRRFAFPCYVRSVLERARGMDRVLTPTSVAVQVGVCMNTDGAYPQFLQIADHLGPAGIVVGMEPDPGNVQRLRSALSKRGEVGPRLIVEQKAACQTAGTAHLYKARHEKDNFIDSMPGAEQWERPETLFSNEQIEVETDSIDNMLQHHGIDLTAVDYVNLTCNGAEFETLKGMTAVLENSRDLAITAIAGRENEGHGEGDIGYIDGRPDHDVISEFLQQYGMRTLLRRFRPNGFGYVVAAKGNKPFFM